MSSTFEHCWVLREYLSIYGGVAQLGEHLPCKQGVMSSNLTISIRNRLPMIPKTYLENRILNKNELYILNQNIKTSEAIQEIVWKNKLVNAKAFMKT